MKEKETSFFSIKFKFEISNEMIDKGSDVATPQQLSCQKWFLPPFNSPWTNLNFGHSAFLCSLGVTNLCFSVSASTLLILGSATWTSRTSPAD